MAEGRPGRQIVCGVSNKLVSLTGSCWEQGGYGDQEPTQGNRDMGVKKKKSLIFLIFFPVSLSLIFLAKSTKESSASIFNSFDIKSSDFIFSGMINIGNCAMFKPFFERPNFETTV